MVECIIGVLNDGFALNSDLMEVATIFRSEIVKKLLLSLILLESCWIAFFENLSRLLYIVCIFRWGIWHSITLSKMWANISEVFEEVKHMGSVPKIGGAEPPYTVWVSAIIVPDSVRRPMIRKEVEIWKAYLIVWGVSLCGRCLEGWVCRSHYEETKSVPY